jgi:hypothetical protein
MAAMLYASRKPRRPAAIPGHVVLLSPGCLSFAMRMLLRTAHITPGVTGELIPDLRDDSLHSITCVDARLSSKPTASEASYAAFMDLLITPGRDCTDGPLSRTMHVRRLMDDDIPSIQLTNPASVVTTVGFGASVMQFADDSVHDWSDSLLRPYATPARPYTYWACPLAQTLSDEYRRLFACGEDQNKVHYRVSVCCTFNKRVYARGMVTQRSPYTACTGTGCCAAFPTGTVTHAAFVVFGDEHVVLVGPCLKTDAHFTCMHSDRGFSLYTLPAKRLVAVQVPVRRGTSCLLSITTGNTVFTLTS